MDDRISRREFLKGAIVGGIGLASMALPVRLKGAQEGASRVAFAHDEKLTSGITPNRELLRPFLEACLRKLTDSASTSDAWRKILPNYNPDQVIGIKVNCINPSLSSHTQLLDALAESLTDFGVPENKIVIWDRRNGELINAGYRINTGETGVRCFGTDSRGWGYDTANPIKVAGQTRYLSKILTSHCDHLINVPVLKDHSIAGVTLSMKNHYGSVDNPGALHGNNCDPFIAELNNTPAIRDKTRLIVLDALLGIYTGGPMGAPQFKPNIIALSIDTVAIDRYGMQLINEERKRRGLGEVTGRAKHIKTAAKLGLGTDDLSRIEILEAELPEDVEPRDKIPTIWGKIKRG
jgi:uncharacterized protein (DUF362 family)